MRSSTRALLVRDYRAEDRDDVESARLREISHDGLHVLVRFGRFLVEQLAVVADNAATQASAGQLFGAVPARQTRARLATLPAAPRSVREREEVGHPAPFG